ncbi:MAG: hypothetical protein R3C26_09765 [Calditrichia bacterium]
MDGDARRALNTIEHAVDLLGDSQPPLVLTKAIFEKRHSRKC